MSKRRYREDEAREILSRSVADEADEVDAAKFQLLPIKAGGVKLHELERIAQAAGVDPARVARAAEVLDVQSKRATVRRSFGLPISVSRVIDLPRAPTDREWDQLISECRTTFGVHGRVTTVGGIREWSCGNLHVTVEPAGDGKRLRITDLKEDAIVINGLGFLLLTMGIVVGSVLAATGASGKGLMAFGVFGGMSLIPFFAANLVRTPAWAREREAQMESIAEHAVKLLSNS